MTAVLLKSPKGCRIAAMALAACLLATGCTSEPGQGEDGDAIKVASSTEVKVTIDSLIKTGIAQTAAGKLDEARTTFDAVYDLDPDNVYALYNLGYIAQSQGRRDEAVARYFDALAVRPSFSPALFNLAFLTEPKDLDVAISLYRRVIAKDAENAAAYVRLGYALVEVGRNMEGKKMLAEGLQLDPSLAEVQPPSYRRNRHRVP